MSAEGPFTHPLLPYTQLGGGLRSSFGTMLPPGGEVVAYVRGDVNGVLAPADGDSQRVLDMLYPSLNAALALCRSGRGDIVAVLPGHAEYIATADKMSNLVAGTKIVGLGSGTVRPTFRWTATGSTFLLDVANVTIENCIFDLCHTGNAGVSVLAPFTVSAAGCGFINNLFRMDGDANDLCTRGVITTDAADYFKFNFNKVYGATAAVSTTFLDILGADRGEMIGNVIEAASSAVGVGLVRFAATAATNFTMLNNYIRNNLASSTAAVTGVAATTGFVNGLWLQTLGSHTDFEVIGDANGCWATSGGSFAFGDAVYASGDLAQRMAPLTPLNS